MCRSRSVDATTSTESTISDTDVSGFTSTQRAPVMPTGFASLALELIDREPLGENVCEMLKV